MHIEQRKRVEDAYRVISDFALYRTGFANNETHAPATITKSLNVVLGAVLDYLNDTSCQEIILLKTQLDLLDKIIENRDGEIKRLSSILSAHGIKHSKKRLNKTKKD